MRRFPIIEPEAPGAPLGHQVRSAAFLRSEVQEEFRKMGVRAIEVGTHIDGEDLRLYLPCAEDQIMLLRFLPNTSGTRIQFYLPLKRLPDDREAAELAAGTTSDTRVLIVGDDNASAAAAAEMVWRGKAGELVEHLDNIGNDLARFLSLRFKTSGDDDSSIQPG